MPGKTVKEIVAEGMEYRAEARAILIDALKDDRAPATAESLIEGTEELTRFEEDAIRAVARLLEAIDKEEV